MNRIARRTDDLPLVPVMPTGQPFVSALVVSCDASHQLLSFRAQRVCGFSEELFCFLATQRCRNPPMVQYFNVATLPAAVAEAEVRWRSR